MVRLGLVAHASPFGVFSKMPESSRKKFAGFRSEVFVSHLAIARTSAVAMAQSGKNRFFGANGGRKKIVTPSARAITSVRDLWPVGLVSYRPIPDVPPSPRPIRHIQNLIAWAVGGGGGRGVSGSAESAGNGIVRYLAVGLPRLLPARTGRSRWPIGHRCGKRGSGVFGATVAECCLVFLSWQGGRHSSSCRAQRSSGDAL